ncbi:MAG TPA: hypothetical protein VI112_03195, partial [Bacteroidia bacterium]
MRLLSEFIRSPYHNKNKNIISFMSLLEQAHPAFSSSRLDPKKVFREVFGSGKFKDVKVRALLSDTLGLTEEFLAWENRKKQGYSDIPFLLNELNARNQDVLFDIRSKKTNERNCQDRSFFLDRFLVSDALIRQKWKQYDNKKEKLAGSGLFENALRQLTEFYAYEGMLILTRMTILQYAIDYPVAMSESAERVLGLTDQIKDLPSVFRFLKLFQRVAGQNDDEAYRELRSKLLSKPDPVLSRAELLMGLDLLSIYCFKRNATGSKDLLKDTFLVLKRYTELNLHLENGFIEEAYFINMVIVALKNGEHQWARNYIHEQEHLLPKESRADVVHYCLGSVADSLKNYKEALLHLNQVQKPGMLIHMNIKCMLIKIYYGKSDMKQVIGTCRTFEKYLSNNSKLSEFQKKIWLNFIRY